MLGNTKLLICLDKCISVLIADTSDVTDKCPCTGYHWITCKNWGILSLQEFTFFPTAFKFRLLARARKKTSVWANCVS